MKIKIAKITFLVVCMGVFLFLLLPFLETTPPPTPAQLKTQPQITTDNPLTAIAKRLRVLFGGKERTARRLSAVKPQVLQVLHPADEFLAAAPAQQPATGVSSPKEQTQPITVPPQEEPFDFGEAALQTDQGEWVLIRQTAPQSGQPGMHEINVHDNPYDRYIKQERAQRALPQQTTPEIPHSKWARLIRPVKQFFGLDTPTPVSPSPTFIYREDPHAHSLASAKEKQTSSKYPSLGPTRFPWPDITPQQWAMMTPQERTREQERRSVAQFADLLSGKHAAEQAAEIAADTKYPNPKNKQEEQAKEQYKQQLIEQNKEIIKNGILQVMEQNAQDKEPVDELSFMLGCNSSLPNSNDSCEDPAVKPSIPALTEDVLAQAQAQNAEKFFEITKYILPDGLPVTPVFGPTSAETIQQMLTNPDPGIKKTGEVYDFLFNWKKCGERTCFWIPTDKQKDPQLNDAVKAMGPGSHLKADPAHVSEAGREPFAQYKVSLLPADASDEEKEQTYQKALKQYEENAAGLVPYVEELKEVQDRIKNAADPKNKDGKAEDFTTFHVTDPTLPPAIAKATNSVLFSYEQISLVNANNRLEAGGQMSISRGYNVKDATDVISQQVTEPTISSAVTQQLSPQKVNPKTTEFNQSGAGWEGIFNATKNLRNSPQ